MNNFQVFFVSQLKTHHVLGGSLYYYSREKEIPITVSHNNLLFFSVVLIPCDGMGCDGMALMPAIVFSSSVG
jgi:hypothetical protein